MRPRRHLISNRIGTVRQRPSTRRAFNLVELLIALAISSALLTATMVALDASFKAYQMTTEVASSHTIGRLTMERLQAMIRTGEEFGPFPLDPKDSLVVSDELQFRTPTGQVMKVEWRGRHPDAAKKEEALWIVIDPGEATEAEYRLLDGVKWQTDADGDPDPDYHPFTLTFALGRNLYRATIDLTIVPDDVIGSQPLTIEGDEASPTIRLVASAMPRTLTYD